MHLWSVVLSGVQYDLFHHVYAGAQLGLRRVPAVAVKPPPSKHLALAKNLWEMVEYKNRLSLPKPGLSIKVRILVAQEDGSVVLQT